MRLLPFVPLFAAGVVAAELTSRVDDWIRFGVPLRHTPDEVTDMRVVDSLGWRGRPYGRFEELQLNNFGFRGPDITLSPRAGCTRILTLGASETQGYLEGPGKEFPAQLRDSLNTRGCYEVLNAGMAGAGIRSITYSYAHYWRQFGAQIVVVYEGPAIYLLNNVPGWPNASELQAQSNPREAAFRPRMIGHLKKAWSTPDFVQRWRLRRWMTADTLGKPAEWYFHEAPKDRLADYLSDLDSLVRTVRASGAVPVVLTHANRFGIRTTPDDSLLLLAWHRFSPRASPAVMLAFEQMAADSVRAYARSHGVTLVDVDRALTGRRELFGDFVHFTRDGAAVVAGRIAQELTTSSVARVSAGKPRTGM